MIRSAIFDLDGTLLDTIYDLADAMNSMLESLGLPPRPLAEHRAAIGDGVRQYTMRVLPDGLRRDSALVDKAAAGMKRRYAEHWCVKTKKYDGVDELLSFLTAHGVRLAVLTNKMDYLAKPMIAHWFADVPFDPVWGEREGVPRKPDPAAALAIAAAHGAQPGQTLFIGDSRFDMATAQNARMHGLGALWGYSSAEELEKSGAEMVANTPRNMLEYIRNFIEEGLDRKHG